MTLYVYEKEHFRYITQTVCIMKSSICVRVVNIVYVKTNVVVK